MSKKISELIPRNNINGNELIPVSVDGTNYCVKANDLSSISETLEIREAFTPEVSFFQNGVSSYLTNYENGNLYITGFTENSHTDAIRITPEEKIQYIEFKFADPNNLILYIGLNLSFTSYIEMNSTKITFGSLSTTYTKTNDIVRIENINNKINIYVNGVLKISSDYSDDVEFHIDEARVITEERLLLSNFKVKYFDRTISSEFASLKSNQTSLSAEIAAVREIANANSSSVLVNKKWSCMGDSNTGVNGYSTYKYHDVIKTKYSMTVNVTCFGGETWANKDGYLKETINDQMAKLTGDEDYISVMAGTNDFGLDITLGSMTDRTMTTFYGALHFTLKKLVAYCYNTGTKNKKLFTMTPVQRGMASEGGKQYTDMLPYINAIKEVSAYYGVPCLDLYTSSGLYNNADGKSEGYKADNLHIADRGHDIIAPRIEKFMEGL